MLHHYELGLLPDDDRRMVELHLLECESCFNAVQDSVPESLMMRHDADIREAIRLTGDSPEDAVPGAIAGTGKVISRWRHPLRAVSAIAAVALALIVFIVQPWDYGGQSGNGAMAAENRVAVLYFNNTTDQDDPDKLGEMASSLLITDLTGSRFIEVVTTQQLYDILKLIGDEGNKRINPDLGRKIANLSGSRWIIRGDILRVEPNLVIAVEIVEAATGEVIALQQVTGLEGQDIFSVVDKLTPKIKQNLSLPGEALEELDKDIADVTTHSMKAYKYYIEGVEFANRIYVPEAIASFEKALEFDSMFAMAYYYLAQMKDAGLITRAVKFGNRATRKEQLYIHSCAAANTYDYEKAISLLLELVRDYPAEKDAFYWLGRYHYDTRQYQAAITYLQRAIEIDPLFKLAYNLLALSYSGNDQFEQSLETVNKYIEIAPDEANPYDTKGGIFAEAGMFDSAITAFETALKIKPDFPYALMQLGHLYVFKRDYEKAESCYARVSKSPDDNIKSQGEYYRALLLLRRGNLKDALGLIDSGAIVRDHTQFPHMQAIPTLIKAYIYWARMDIDGTRQAFLESFQIYSQYFPSDSCWSRYLYAHFLAEIGETDQARDIASSILTCRYTFDDTLSNYWYALGAIEMYNGSPDQAVAYFEKAYATNKYFPIKYMLGRAYFEAGRYRDCEHLFIELLDTHSVWRLFWSLWDIEIYYYLGLSYEQTGDYQKALANYQIFIDIWSDADHQMMSRYDVQERIVRLKSQL